jgi:hypothetical protein
MTTSGGGWSRSRGVDNHRGRLLQEDRVPLLEAEGRARTDRVDEHEAGEGLYPRHHHLPGDLRQRRLFDRELRQGVEELSKVGHQYFGFIPEEGCRYLKNYLEWRMRPKEVKRPFGDGRRPQVIKLGGERLGPESPLIGSEDQGTNLRDDAEARGGHQAGHRLGRLQVEALRAQEVLRGQHDDGRARAAHDTKEAEQESDAVVQEREVAAEPDVESEEQAESKEMEVETEEESEEHESEEIEDREGRMLSDKN